MDSHCFVVRTCLLTTAISFFGFAAWADTLPAAEPIIVELWDGHVVQGETDLNTDERLLWLRRESAGVQVASGFPWERVRLVRSGQQVFSGRDFLPVAQNTKSAGKT